MSTRFCSIVVASQVSAKRHACHARVQLGVRAQPLSLPVFSGINRGKRNRVTACLFKRLYFNHFVCQKPFVYFQ